MYASFALFTGIFLAFVFGNPFSGMSKKLVRKLLPWSIVGLGFGTDLSEVITVGFTSIWYTFFGILFTAIFGIFLGYVFNISRNLSVLITFGTAICGGSAIAAISPAIKADHHDTSTALAVVFLLNSIALLLFPFIGHLLDLSQEQFGLWSALAIHDTSSVVGATMQYGAESLSIGTTIKLARALWIVPITFMISIIYTHKFNKHLKKGGSKPQKPWFILWFLCAAACVTWIPFLKTPGMYIRHIAEVGLIFTLFLIGSNFSKSSLKQLGIKPFLQGVLLWLVILILTLLAIYFKIISV